MGLIKSADVPMGLSPFSMKDIEAAARGILLNARKKAEQIIAAAQAEADVLKKQAQRDGSNQGLKEGTERGLAEGRKSGHAQALSEHGAAMTKLTKSLTEAAQQLEQRRDDLETAALREVIELSCAIARRVTKRQGVLDPQVMVNNLKEAMSLAVHAADVRVAVHPSQMETLKRELPNLKLAWPQLKHIDLSEDASIAQGGARIFTTGGQVDGTLNAQLDRIVDELLPQPANQQ